MPLAWTGGCWPASGSRLYRDVIVSTSYFTSGPARSVGRGRRREEIKRVQASHGWGLCGWAAGRSAGARTCA
eukprot:226022-Prymnesium_polylepis.1